MNTSILFSARKISIFLILFLILSFPLTSFGALDFDSAGSDRKVVHGSDAELDDLPATGMTVWAWVYRTSDGANQEIVTKDNSFPSGWDFVVDNESAEGGIRLVAFRTNNTNTNWADASSAANETTLNTWRFVAGTVDIDGSSPLVKLYSGGLLSTVREVSSYFRQQDGTGSYLSDASHNLWVGNLQRSNALPFRGKIARGGIVNRALSVGELRQIQFGSRSNVLGTVLLFDYFGTGTQPDRSGNRNSGTVTSAIAFRHVPLGNLFGR